MLQIHRFGCLVVIKPLHAQRFGALSLSFCFAISQATHFSMLLNALNVFSFVTSVLGSHGFLVFMVSFVLFVSTLVALTSGVVLTNANGGPHREDGHETNQES